MLDVIVFVVGPFGGIQLSFYFWLLQTRDRLLTSHEHVPLVLVRDPLVTSHSL